MRGVFAKIWKFWGKSVISESLIMHPCSAFRGRRKGRRLLAEDHIFIILRPRAQNRAHKSRFGFGESFLQKAQLARVISLSSERTRFCAIYGWKVPEVFFPTVLQDHDSDVCGGSYAHFRNGARCWKSIRERPNFQPILQGHSCPFTLFLP